MVWSFWSPKGGSGCSTVVVATGRWRSEREPVLLVDLGGDLSRLVGVDVEGPGLADWLVASEPPPDALSRLEIELRPNLMLLPWAGRGLGGGRATVGGAGTPLPDRGGVLARILANDHRLVLIDGGVHAAGLPEVAAMSSRSIAVTRACYLALHGMAMRPPPDELVVVAEAGRALRRVDVEAAAGAPVTVALKWDPAVARAVDAGRLLSRPPRSLRPLRRIGASS